jgi:hypothetical protein
MTTLRLVREARTMNPSPGKKEWFKRNPAVGNMAAVRAPSTRPKGGLSVPVVWIHTSFVHPTTQDTHAHRIISTQKNFRGRLPPFSVPGSYTLNQQHKPQNAGSSPSVSQQWAFCGPSISELNHKYRMTFRPIIVRHGRLAGWGPTYE